MSTCRWSRDAGDYLTDDGLPCASCVSLPERLAGLYQGGEEWECWPWKSTVSTVGYGVLSIHNRQFKAHRVTYELERGRIPDGLVIDHLCRNRVCVNPSHLEPVEVAENNLRGVSPWAINARRTVCKQGHPYTPENTRYDKGRRYCLECKRRSSRETKRRMRARLKEAG